MLPDCRCSSLELACQMKEFTGPFRLFVKNGYFLGGASFFGFGKAMMRSVLQFTFYRAIAGGRVHRIDSGVRLVE